MSTATKRNPFVRWFETFVSEKGFDLEQDIVTRRGTETRVLPLSFIVEYIKIAPVNEQNGIKAMFVRIDFANGDCLDYFAHLGGALWEHADEFINL